MTTLFNLFCPLVGVFKIKTSVFFMTTLTLVIVLYISLIMLSVTFSLKKSFSLGLFPSLNLNLSLFISLFFILALLNLVSLSVYSYPVTTTLSFNLSLAFFMWFSSLLITTLKPWALGVLLPANSPWYLSAFLSLVEFVSTGVRPVTLCFRLLANMSAGHILLALICKMNWVWLSGSLFGMLELMVGVVQSFVFLMLISVYLEESVSH